MHCLEHIEAVTVAWLERHRWFPEEEKHDITAWLIFSILELVLS